MVYADFKCQKCEHIFLGFKKRVHDNFPFFDCPECGAKDTIRLFTPVAIQVAEGKLGNAKNGYTNNIIYKPASMTPKKHFDNIYPALSVRNSA